MKMLLLLCSAVSLFGELLVCLSFKATRKVIVYTSKNNNKLEKSCGLCVTGGELTVKVLV